MMTRLFGILLAISLLGCGGVTVSTNSVQPPEASNQPVAMERKAERADDARFGAMLNALRAENGAPPVTFDARLDRAAQAHAEDMVARGYFGHRNPEGLMEIDRIKATGYNPKSWGENLAGRQLSQRAALNAWINSPEHNRLLNARTVTEYGLGVAGSGLGTRWVLIMAKPKG